MFCSGVEYMVSAAKGVQSAKLVPSIKAVTLTFSFFVVVVGCCRSILIVPCISLQESARPALECSNKSPSRVEPHLLLACFPENYKVPSQDVDLYPQCLSC